MSLQSKFILVLASSARSRYVSKWFFWFRCHNQISSSSLRCRWLVELSEIVSLIFFFSNLIVRYECVYGQVQPCAQVRIKKILFKILFLKYIYNTQTEASHQWVLWFFVFVSKFTYFYSVFAVLQMDSKWNGMCVHI